MPITPNAAPAKRSFLSPPPNMTSTTADTTSTEKNNIDKPPVTKQSCSGTVETSNVANLQQEGVRNYMNQARFISSTDFAIGRQGLGE